MSDELVKALKDLLCPSPAPTGYEKEVARMNETRGVVCCSRQCQDSICAAWWERYARLPVAAREAIGNVLEAHR